MDAATGQVTIMQNAAIDNMKSIKADRFDPDASGAKMTATAETMSNNDRLHGRKYTSRRQTPDS